MKNKHIFRVRKINGKQVRKEGMKGKGVTLPFSCGFCRDRHGNATAAFRSQRERNDHTNRCAN